MAGNANSGPRRVNIPTGKAAEEELRRLRRQERRKLRADKKKALAAGLDSDELVADAPAPTKFDGKLPSGEELKAMFGQAFMDLGGPAGLVAWGSRYPKEFYAIWARMCLPKESEAPASNSLESMLKELDSGATLQ